MRTTSRDGSGRPIRSAFVRRDDAGENGDEMTAEKYLQSLLVEEHSSMPRISSVSEEDRAPMPHAGEGERSITPQTSSAQTRDAARLRSIMRGSEPQSSRSTAPTSVIVEPTLEMRKEEEAEPVPVVSTDVAPMGIPLPSVMVPLAQADEPVPAPVLPLVDTEQMNEVDIETPTVIPPVESKKIVSMESATAGIDTVERRVVEELNDAGSITIVRYPQESGHLAPMPEPVFELESLTLAVSATSDSGSEVEAVEADDAMPIVAVAAPAVSVEADKSSNVDDEEEGEIFDREIPLPFMNPIPPKPLATVPPRKEISEDVQRKATRLRPPEPRATEVRLPRTLRINASTAVERVVEKKPTRNAAIETRLRSTAIEPSAPRPLASVPMRRAADAAATASRPSSPVSQSSRPSQPGPSISSSRAEVLRSSPVEDPRVSASEQMRWQEPSQAFEEMGQRAVAREPQMEEKGGDPFAAEFQKKKNVVFAVTTMTVGVILGLGLYAGGADYISGLFANKHEGIGQSKPSAVAAAASSQGNSTESATEHAIDPVPQSDRAASGTTSNDDAAAAADKPEAARSESDESSVGERKPQRERSATHTDAKHIAGALPKVVAKQTKSVTTAKAEKGVLHESIAKGIAAKGEKTTKAATPHTLTSNLHPTTHDRDAAAAKGKKEITGTKTAAGAFTVQVRATKDGDEAKRIAAKLRARGVKGVTIVASESSGNSKLYRVRFGSYGTTSDAKLAAGKVGVDGAWVVKQH